MNVLIDLTSLADNFSGIERFALSITKELINNTIKTNAKYILIFKNEIHTAFRNISSDVECVILHGKNKLLTNQLILPWTIRKIKADYYFFPAFPAPFFLFKKNAVTTIHDMGVWDSPSQNKRYMIAYFKIMYYKAAWGNKQIITVSDFSKKRIVSILKKNPSQIKVIYDGLSDCFESLQFNETENKITIKTYNLPKDYILCLSTLEPRKNIKLLLEAYDELLQEEKIDIDLVLAGRKGWAVDDLMDNLNANTIKRVHFTGFIEDSKLPYVYKNAKLFVFPSVYEGFGIPPLEAMSMGVPVISSDAASLPEILEDAAFYFRSKDCNDLKQQIIHVLSLSKEELNAVENKGIAQAHKYNWKREAARLTAAVFV